MTKKNCELFARVSERICAALLKGKYDDAVVNEPLSCGTIRTQSAEIVVGDFRILVQIVADYDKERMW